MKQVLIAATAASLLLMPGSAFAQQLLPGAGGAPSAAVSADDQLETATIVAALSNTQTETNELLTLAPGATVRIVQLEDYLTGPDAEQINAALVLNEDFRENLRRALEGNAAITAELQTNSITLDQVAAVDVSGTEILIFTFEPSDLAPAADVAPGGGAGAGAGGAVAPGP